MIEPIKWIDDCYVTKERIVLTNNELQIPGLRTFAKHTTSNAISPLPRHYHENAFEFTFIRKGVFSFHTDHSKYQVTSGDVFIAYPNEVHSTDQVPLSLGEIYWFQLDISELCDLLYLSNEAARMLVEQLSQMKGHVIKTSGKDTSNILIKAFSLTLSERNNYMIASYLTVFLHQLIEHAQERQFRLTPDIGSTLDYIMDHLTSNISLEQLADHCHLSISQFKQKFKFELGNSPRDFINRQKVEYAKSLLCEKMPITEIAMLLGFNTSSYFSVVFKKYTTFTPSEYIKTISI